MFTKYSQNVHDFHVKAVIMYIVNDDTQLIIKHKFKIKIHGGQNNEKSHNQFPGLP